MKTMLEEFDGDLVDAVVTVSDEDAHDQLMHRTGEFLNMLEHCARFHPSVITGAYLGDVLDDLDHLQIKFSLASPIHPSMQ